jgi:hypothetical protein
LSRFADRRSERRHVDDFGSASQNVGDGDGHVAGLPLVPLGDGHFACLEALLHLVNAHIRVVVLGAVARRQILFARKIAFVERSPVAGDHVLCRLHGSLVYPQGLGVEVGQVGRGSRAVGTLRAGGEGGLFKRPLLELRRHLDVDHFCCWGNC